MCRRGPAQICVPDVIFAFLSSFRQIADDFSCFMGTTQAALNSSLKTLEHAPADADAAVPGGVMLRNFCFSTVIERHSEGLTGCRKHCLLSSELLSAHLVMMSLSGGKQIGLRLLMYFGSMAHEDNHLHYEISPDKISFETVQFTVKEQYLPFGWEEEKNA